MLTVAPENIFVNAGEDGKKGTVRPPTSLESTLQPKLSRSSSRRWNGILVRCFRTRENSLVAIVSRVIEDEDDRAPEIASEFYPAEETRALPEAAPESNRAGPPSCADILQSYDDVPSRVRQPERPFRRASRSSRAGHADHRQASRS